MKTCVITCKQLGDTLLLQPALAKLAERDGQEVALQVRGEFEPLVRRMPGVRMSEAGESFDELWVFEHGSKATGRAWLTRAKQKRLRLLRPEYRRWYHSAVFHDIAAQPLAYHYRALSHYRAVTGGDLGFAPPVLDRDGLEVLPGEVQAGSLVVSPTSAWESKAWVPEAWAKVIDEAQERCGLPVVIVGQGTGWVQTHVERIIALSKNPVLNLVNRTTLEDLMAIVAGAGGVMGIDGAVLHIAAALRRPVLALFGPTRVEEWFWPSATSFVLTAGGSSGRRAPLSDLSVQPVLDKLRDLLAV